MLTYGDGVSDVDIRRLVEFHKSHGKIATVTTVPPISRFGVIDLAENERVSSFNEKPKTDGWINAGFFVFNRQVFDYLGGDECIFEREPLERLARDGQLMAYRHDGFFYAMDTYREYQHLNELWSRGRAVEGLGVSGFWQDRPVLVTGATGLVGAWLTRRLLDAGADVVCLVRDWVPQSELVRTGTLDRVKVVRGDIRHRDVVERAIGEYEIDTVIHLAAQTIVGIANRNPISTFESNIQGTWNLLEACRRAPLVKSIVIASSDKAYGDQEKLPYSEDAAAAGAAPLRRQQVLRRPDRAGVRQNLRAAGGRHALRQFLRRRRSQLEPHRARHHPLDLARRTSGDPLRRPVHPRLLLRGRRRRGLHAAGRTAPRPARTARHGVQFLQ